MKEPPVCCETPMLPLVLAALLTALERLAAFPGVSAATASRLEIAEVPERVNLFREAMEFSVKITAAGNETFESWRESEHDDLVLSLALACWAAETLRWSDGGRW
jgi:hypothetical protein